jgi:adenosylhomocysteinase
MDGYQVTSLMEASRVGDIFITASGDKNVIDKYHLQAMKDGAILANSGHFNVEINIPALESMARSKRHTRPFVDEYILNNGHHLYLLGEGRLINLAAAEGHPASVMDMSFANQALCLEYMAKNRESLEPKIYSVPEEIDKQIARLKLNSMGIGIDSLTPEQKEYLTSWEQGT